MKMGKHAYLIMAHNDWDLLSKLFRCLDDKRNSLFVHIDKKSEFNPNLVFKPKNAECVFINRRKVSWGGYSQIAVELDLLSAALEAGTFDYYHLISVQDLPLKGQDYIHTFFEQNAGKNFILFDANAKKNHLVEERFQQYHFLQNSIGRNSGLWIAFLERVERLSISIQKSLKVNRISKYPHKVYKGGNWFSITHEMASYVVSRKNDIKKWFNYSLCADELFLQTVAMESPLRETIIDDSLREIDWERGKPYTYRSDDYELLMSSHNLFARKFSSDIDKNIIEMVYENAVSK